MDGEHLSHRVSVWLAAGSLLGSVLLLVAVLDELPGRALLF